MASTTTNHPFNCTCPVCDPLGLRHSPTGALNSGAGNAFTTAAQAWNMAQQNNQIQAQGVMSTTTSVPAPPTSGLRKLINYVLGTSHQPSEQIYARATDKQVTPIHVYPKQEDASVQQFVLGRVPSTSVVYGAPCFLDLEDVPAPLRESVMLLQTGYNEEELFKIPRVGTMRRIAPGVFYFSVFI